VAIDGVPVEQFTLESLRRQIAYVSQSPFLFSASVKDNLRYLNTAATDAEIVEACRMARADGFVSRMPQGYDSLLGEDGQRLSGGERQRIVLARALLSGAKILVLDEPTSALDFESERDVQAALNDIVGRGGITLIVIAHRLSTIKGADHLIVMERGHVIKAGEPALLQSDDNWFRRMIEAQAVAV
jgi:ATP-binding cassette subfamily B protein